MSLLKDSELRRDNVYFGGVTNGKHLVEFLSPLLPNGHCICTGIDLCVCSREMFFINVSDVVIRPVVNNVVIVVANSVVLNNQSIDK